jgi:predicted DNA binding CopG/RHH family protein
MAQTIEIPVPDELLRLVDERAQNAGLPREAYIRAVLVSERRQRATLRGRDPSSPCLKRHF